MTTEALKNHPNRALTERRQKIISSILTDGLLPASKLDSMRFTHLPSVEEEACEDVQGNILNPGASYADIIWLLYPTFASIFPVVTERKAGEIWPETEEQASERARASFLILCSVSKLKTQETDIIYDSSDIGDGLSFPEGVNPSLFSHLVFPREIWEELEDVEIPQTANVLLVENSVRRYLYRRNKVPAVVPDYESLLREFAKSITEPYWIHVTRLPALTDL